MDVILFGAIAVGLWLNAAATYHLLHSRLYARNQKLWQSLIIWLVPLFGAILVLSVMARSRSRPRFQEQPMGVPGTILGFLTLDSWVHRADTAAGDADMGPADFGGFDGGGMDGDGH